jgi:hypothetical protein
MSESPECHELVRLRLEVERARDLLQRSKNALRQAVLQSPDDVPAMHSLVEQAEFKLQYDLKAFRLHQSTHLDCKKK